MRLAITNDLHVNGGAVSLMAHRYALALNQAGHHCTLITGRGSDALPTDVPVAAWDYPARKPGLIGSIKLAKEIRSRSAAAFKAWKDDSKRQGTAPDGWLAMVIPSADGAMRGGGAELPLLYICNSPWAMEWDAAYESVHGHRAAWWRRLPALAPRRHMERGVVSRANGWTSLSQLQLDWFLAEHPMCASIPKQVVSGAVICSEYQPLSRAERDAIIEGEGLDPRLPTLVCSRRLVPRTGVDLLIGAHRAMKSDANLVITGGGPQLGELQLLANVSPRAKQVRLLGFIERERLRALTSAATVAVLPTRALEGFGLSAAEAFASGTPVVATPVTALVDVVGGLDKRLLSREVSAQALAEALDSFIHNDELSSEAFRQRCHAYAEQKFDWGRLKVDFVAMVERVLKR